MKTLMPRDKKLLALMERYQVLSTNQIRRLIFSDLAPTNMFRRLRLLEKRNLIRRNVGMRDHSYAWCLAAEGASALGTNAPRIFLNRNTIDHDVTLTNVRLALETVGLGEKWVDEMRLRRLAFTRVRNNPNDMVVIPDGILPVATKDGIRTIAVELELNSKNRRRYREIFKKYRKMDTLMWVWYIVPTPSLGKLLLEEWSKIEQWTVDPEPVWSTLTQVLNDPWNIEIHTADGKFYMRKFVKMKELEAKKSPSLSQKPAQNPLNLGVHHLDHGVIREIGKKSAA